MTLILVGFFQNCAPVKSNADNVSGSVALLSTSVKLDGQCDLKLNSCLSGTMQNIADSSTQSLWRCNGQGGGTSLVCSSAFSDDMIDGICGNRLNNCQQGFMVDMPDSGNENLWRCDGFNGGAAANCVLARTSGQVTSHGQCGTTPHSCNVGALADLPDSLTQNLWICRGVLGGRDTNCATTIINTPVTGSALCGTEKNSCSEGAVFSDLNDSTSQFVWRCSKNGAFGSCMQQRPSCLLTAQTRAHVGETITFNAGLSSGTLPSNVKIKILTSRTNLDGSGFSNLPTEYKDLQVPISFNIENKAGVEAGVYVRRFAILDPANGDAEICQTNNVTYTLTPACSLEVSKTNGILTDTFSYTIETPKADQIPLAKPARSIVMYGTRTPLNSTIAENDETGSSVLLTTNFPFKFGPFTADQETKTGLYSRYYIAKDSSNQIELCKSNTITFVVNPVPVVTTPTPMPTPTPTPEPVPVNQACTLEDKTIPHNSTIKAYFAKRVNYGTSCDAISETRTCLNGVLSASNSNAIYASCTPDATVTLSSCREVFGTSADNVRCEANEVAQSFSVYATKHLASNPKLTCCQMNVDMAASEVSRRSPMGTNADNTEHLAACGPNEMVVGMSVTSTKNHWDGNLTVICRAIANPDLVTNTLYSGAYGKNGLTNYERDNQYHTASCGGNQVLTAIGLWATGDRLDNISRMGCGSPSPILPVPVDPINPGCLDYSNGQFFNGNGILPDCP